MELASSGVRSYEYPGTGSSALTRRAVQTMARHGREIECLLRWLTEWHLTAITLAFLIAALLALPAPAVAQATLAGNSTDGHLAIDTPSIPRNVMAAPMLRQTMHEMSQRSRTFNAQCARLRAATGLSVEIRFGNPSQIGQAEARTHVARQANEDMRATIYIDGRLRSFAQLTEVIAHELEHVIEQLDGADLTPVEGRGVFRRWDGALETARAIYIGQKVRQEVAGSR
jgi:hypothetical protein